MFLPNTSAAYAGRLCPRSPRNRSKQTSSSIQYSYVHIIFFNCTNQHLQWISKSVLDLTDLDCFRLFIEFSRNSALVQLRTTCRWRSRTLDDSCSQPASPKYKEHGLRLWNRSVCEGVSNESNVTYTVQYLMYSVYSVRTLSDFKCNVWSKEPTMHAPKPAAS